MVFEEIVPTERVDPEFEKGGFGVVITRRIVLVGETRDVALALDGVTGAVVVTGDIGGAVIKAEIGRVICYGGPAAGGIGRVGISGSESVDVLGAGRGVLLGDGAIFVFQATSNIRITSFRARVREIFDHGEKTVVYGVRTGKEVAYRIDAYLEGK